MSKKKSILIFLIFSLFRVSAQENSVLVFSKTLGYRHSSIKEGQEFFKTLAKKNNFKISLSENSSDFNEENLKKYNAVVFLNTTGDILHEAEQNAFERYIQAGGGFMGIHAATDTEYKWQWYNKLAGAYFMSHPGTNVSNVQNGNMITLDKSHASTRHLPNTFEKIDEFYDFKSLQTESLNFLIKVDETSYKEGKMGAFHPMSWHQEFDGGKSFYTNFGHTPETFKEPLMIPHFEEGLKYVWANKLDYNKTKTDLAPEENRFIKSNLLKNLDEPTELTVLPNGKVIFVERKGAIKLWDPAKNKSKTVGHLNVYQKFEYGLMGIGVDPNYSINNWLYLYYSPETDEHTDQFLSRFTYDEKNDTLLYESEKVILRVKTKRVDCCHTGGSIDWDSNGNLFLSTGDDTNPFASDGYAPIDFRDGRQGWDALSTSGNTNDLRGKILRITPKADGSYSIPAGNLFPVGMDKTRPEIYVMGNRNPYRISVDKKTNYLYWGEIGPDAGKDNSKRGPQGYVEFNVAKKPGNYGWPLFAGNNSAYHEYDFKSNESGELFNPEKPKNNSPNNTGLRFLPPTQKPLIWYGYGPSKEFPLLEKGGANPMGGPMYHYEEYSSNASKFPKYYDNKLFIYEWMRDWILIVSTDKEGNYIGMEPFMPSTKFYHPMDMAFNSDGVMYLLEYGMNWFTQNEEAMLSKIEFNSGNRKPLVIIGSNKKEGALPLVVQFNSNGTKDYDNDNISYNWIFGKGMPNSTLANPKITFTKPGEYNVTLEVTDSKGYVNKESLIIKAGNELPSINISVNSNKTFFLNDNFNYSVSVSDKEDGTVNNGIKPEDVIVSINYLEGFDKTMLEQGHKSNESFATGRRLIDLSDCAACHSKDKKSIGPSYIDIATKYPKNNNTINKLANKIIAGGGGVWGEQAMAAHPTIKIEEAKDIADYILSIKDLKNESKPLSGLYEAKEHKTKKDGAYIIQASYTDKGGKIIGPLTSSSLHVLKSPIIKAINYDLAVNTQKLSITNDEILVAFNESNVTWQKIDLKGITKITLNLIKQKDFVGGKVTIKAGGKSIGSIEVPAFAEGRLDIILKEKPLKPEDLIFEFNNPNYPDKPLLGMLSIEFNN